MSHYIGDTEITAITEVDEGQETNVEEIDVIGLEDPLVVEHEPDREQLTLDAALVKMLHSDNLNIEQQRENVLALLRSAAGDNSFKYMDDFTGWLSIEDVDAGRGGDAKNIHNVTISATLLPEAVYQAGTEYTSSLVGNDFNIDRPGTFTLPSFVHNVKVRNPVSGDEVDLVPIATESTEDGDIDIYSLFTTDKNTLQAFNGATKSLNVEYSGLQDITLDAQSERAVIDGMVVPEGNYKFVTRLQDNNVSGDVKFVVYSKTDGAVLESMGGFSTGTTNVTTLRSSEFTIPDNDNYAFRVEKDTTNANTILIDNIYLEPQFTPQILFDVEVGADLSTESSVNISGESFNVPDRLAPVRVYDDMGSPNIEADWERVQNIDHSFEGNIVVDNGIIRLHPIEGSQGNSNQNNGECLTMSVRSGGTWNDFIVRNFTYHNLYDTVVTESNPQKCSFTIRGDQDTEWAWDITLHRGDYLCSIEYRNSGGTSKFVPPSHTDLNFGAEVDGITSGTHTGTTAAYTANSTDNWITVPHLTNNYLIVGAGSRSSVVNNLWVGDDRIQEIRLDADPGKKAYLGAVPFSETANLYSEAENTTLSANTSINHWETYLTTAGALNEHSGATASFTEDTTNGLLSHSADAKDAIYLNAIQWGASQTSNHYRWTQIDASDTTGAENAYCKFGSQNTTADDSEYEVELDFTNNSVYLIHYDGTGTPTTLVSNTAFTLAYTSTYNVEVEWSPSTPSIDVYIWDSANTKPTSATLTSTDSSFSSGKVGYGAYGSIDINDWSVDAEEVTSSGNSAAIAVSKKVTGANEGIQFDFTGGTDLPLGTYLTVFRSKVTDGDGSLSNWIYLFNQTDSTTIDVDGSGKFDNQNVSNSYQFHIRQFRVDSDDDGDTILNRHKTNDSNEMGHMIIDEALLVPVSLQAGGDRMGPQDIAHEALRELETRSVVRER